MRRSGLNAEECASSVINHPVRACVRLCLAGLILGLVLIKPYDGEASSDVAAGPTTALGQGVLHDFRWKVQARRWEVRTKHAHPCVEVSVVSRSQPPQAMRFHSLCGNIEKFPLFLSVGERNDGKEATVTGIVLDYKVRSAVIYLGNGHMVHRRPRLLSRHSAASIGVERFRFLTLAYEGRVPVHRVVGFNQQGKRIAG